MPAVILKNRYDVTGWFGLDEIFGRPMQNDMPPVPETITKQGHMVCLDDRKSAGRHFRHNAVNDIIKRALASAETPAILEPASLSRSDGKRPDGLSIVPRGLEDAPSCGTSPVHDTLALSHLNRAVVGPRAVANDAEKKKKSEYSSLSPIYDFTPIAVETLGPVGESALDFLQELGRHIASSTAEPRSFSFLMQRISVAAARERRLRHRHRTVKQQPGQ